MCCVSTTDEVTAGALPASLLELIDAKVPLGRHLREFAVVSRGGCRQDRRTTGRRLVGVIVGAFELADAAEGTVRVVCSVTVEDGYGRSAPS
jgi:hypothetical protein